MTWAELFFDLVFVFAVTEVAQLLRVDHSLLGAGHAAVAFVPIYWVGVGTCVYANTHGLDGNGDRIGLFAIGLGGMFMALAVPGAYGDRGVLFGAAYLAVRIVLLFMVWRAGRGSAACDQDRDDRGRVRAGGGAVVGSTTVTRPAPCSTRCAPATPATTSSGPCSPKGTCCSSARSSRSRSGSAPRSAAPATVSRAGPRRARPG